MKEKLGKLFTRTGEDVWRLVSFTDEPTAVFMNIEDKSKSGGVVSSTAVKSFVEMKPVGKLSDDFRPLKLDASEIEIDGKN